MADSQIAVPHDTEHNTEAFRARYRAGIPAWYSAWLHGGFVLVYGLGCIYFFWRTLDQVTPLEWLAVPLTLLYSNWSEYMVHKNFGHHKARVASLFYKRHTGDHHSFFVADQMRYDGARDWRVILFPPWLIVLVSVTLALPVWWLLSYVNSNVAGLVGGMLIVSYLAYEFFHACEHLPDENPVTKLPWISQMRRLHQLHHRRDLMQSKNFNLIFPLTDWLLGTLYWEKQTTATARWQNGRGR